jgi:hypothetical protein
LLVLKAPERRRSHLPETVLLDQFISAPLASRERQKLTQRPNFLSERTNRDFLSERTNRVRRH